MHKPTKLGRTVPAGGTHRYYVGGVDRACPGIAQKVGRYEIRLVYSSPDAGSVASQPQVFGVSEPEGLYAEALHVLEAWGEMSMSWHL
jgi:hypothetical protein